MKLKKFHMFLILLASLMTCCLAFSAYEGFETDSKGNRVDANYNLGSKSDPFKNNPVMNFNLASNQDKIQSSVPASKIQTIPKSQIPPGDEDLYILKSQIVPPVCPKCPDVKQCDKEQDCPPCPAPKRCPDRPFECKMVPKYSDPRVSSHLPRPVLNDFSTFA